MALVIRNERLRFRLARAPEPEVEVDACEPRRIPGLAHAIDPSLSSAQGSPRLQRLPLDHQHAASGDAGQKGLAWRDLLAWTAAARRFVDHEVMAAGLVQRAPRLLARRGVNAGDDKLFSHSDTVGEVAPFVRRSSAATTLTSRTGTGRDHSG